jgi:DNA-binding CsgD family transcriptional regulator
MSVTLVLADDQPIILYGLEHLFAHGQDSRPGKLCHRCASPQKTADGPVGATSGGIAHASSGLFVGAQGRLVVQAIHLGARGVVLKDMAPKLLVQCIRKVHAGGEWLERRSVARLLGRIRQREAQAQGYGAVLTRRELEVVHMVAGGLSNQAIGKRLSIGEGTVKVHVHHIYAKLKVTSRVALLLHAREKGWVQTRSASRR